MNKRKPNKLKLIVFDKTLKTAKKKQQIERKLFQAAATFSIKHQNESMSRNDEEQHLFPFDEAVSEAFVSNLLSDGR